MYKLSDPDGALWTWWFSSFEEATEFLNEKGFIYVDVDGWVQEDEDTWTQYQFVLDLI